MRLVGKFLVPVIFGLAWGSLTYQWLKINRHPDIVTLCIVWSAVGLIVAVIREQWVLPWLAGRRLSGREKAFKLCLCVGVCGLLGLGYGDSLIPPRADPGQRLDGLFFGLIGGVFGVWLGWPQSDPGGVQEPDIGFEI